MHFVRGLPATLGFSSMHIAESLLLNSAADRDLLQKNAARGDDATIPREVVLLLCASTQEKAELVASFITDNSFGVASVQYSEGAEPEEEWGILVRVVTPTTEHVICCISGLMECIANLFKIKFDGWEGELKIAQQSVQPDRREDAAPG
jgi:hypothetical protein